MCEDLAVNEIGCPPLIEKLKNIPEIDEAFNNVFDKIQTETP